MEFNLFPISFRNKFNEILDTEKDYTSKETKTLNSVNILISAFFDKEEIKGEIIELMKCLKGFEAQTLIVDKFLDNPKTKDKEMRVIVGFILQATMTDKFFEILNKLKLNSEKKLALLNKWNDTLKQIYIGQGIDYTYTHEKIKPINLKEYFLMIEKTTSPMILLPLYIACSIKNFGDKETNKILDYGKNFGLAFQIKDDYEDFENDVFEGKQRAFIVKEFFDTLPKDEKDFILENYRKKPKDCVELIKKSTIPEKVIKLNQEYINKSLDSLKNLRGNYIEKLRYIADLCKIKS
ncbi:MAG: polyprenyl synthetase family protein [archaeon]|nr:polyprenyl synthetase family protein [archaeon]